MIFTTGGNEPDGRSRAKEAAYRLQTHYDINEDDIISLPSEGSTFGNAKRVITELSNRPDEIGTLKAIEVVTNDFHMLRSWLIFSMTVRSLERHEDLTISEDEKQKNFSVIDESLAMNDEQIGSSIKSVRETIMNILSPYFATNSIKVIPVVSEEILEESAKPALQRYARAVRNNIWIQENLKLEYQGVKDLLNKTYRF